MLTIRIHKMLLVFLLVAILLPFTPVLFNQNSFYVPNVIIYCKNDSECRHEVGHLMDHDMGDESKSKEFGDAIWIYLYVQDRIGGDTIVRDTIISAPGVFYYSDLFHVGHLEGFSSPQQELYAQIYANVGGDVDKLPEVLKPFYSDGEKYSRIYSYLAVHHIILFQ